MTNALIGTTEHRKEAAPMTEELFTQLQPVIAAAHLELVDVELRSGVLLVTVDREGGVDLQALTDANRAVSGVLDELDPIPGRYTLEVSSPGVERTLRTPAHFAKAVGETVTVKTRPQVPGDRRRRGVLVAADEHGLTLEEEGGPDEGVRLAYSDIDKARTVFLWGPEPKAGKKAGTKSGQPKGAVAGTAKPGSSSKGGTSPRQRADTTAATTADTTDDKTTVMKRKQVVSP
jgi:ribosome maturation factor RimP